MSVLAVFLLILWVGLSSVVAQPVVTRPGTGGGGGITATGGVTLENKAISATTNTLSGIGFGEVVPDLISGHPEQLSPGAGMYFLIWDGGALKKADIDNLPVGSGQINTVSNVGAGGVGLFKQKVGVDSQLKNINAGSNKITVTDDTGNSEVDIGIVEANIQVGNLAGAPLGAVVGTTDAQALTNKTISAATNTLTNIGFGEVVPDIISGHAEDTDPGASEYVLLLNSGGALRKAAVTNIMGSGEINTASNVGSAGVGLFKQKVAGNLELKKVNAGSNKVTIFDDTANSKVDIGLTEANIVIGNLSGAPTGAVVGTTDTQTLTNKTIDADGTGNVITNIGSSEIKAELVDGLTLDSTPVAGDMLLGTTGGLLRRFNVANLPDTGENNVLVNVGVGGVSIGAGKNGNDLLTRSINAGSSKISVTLDDPNKEVDVDVVEANVDITQLANAPTGAVVGTSDAQTLTGKTISAASNTLTGIGFGEVVGDVISGQAAQATPNSGMFFLILDGGTLKKVDFDNMPGAGGGEINTASNVGAGGVGLFKQKTIADLELKNINAGSTKITITDDTGNSELDIDVAEANIVIGNLSGAPTGDVVGTSDTQTFTNKTFDADGTGNVLTNVGSSEIKAELVDGLLENATPSAGDMILSTTGGLLRKIDVGNMADVTSVLGCLSGACDAMTPADGAALNFSSVNMSDATEGVWFGVDGASACANAIGDGQACYDSVNKLLTIGDGSTANAIGPGLGSITLDQAFDSGKTIDGADSQANAMVVGDGTDGWRFYVGASGPTAECFIGGGGCDVDVNVPATHTYNLNLDGTDNQISIAADTGAVTLKGTLREVQTSMIPAGMFIADGTQCVRKLDQTLGSEVQPVTVVCADSDAATIRLEFPAPKRWDEATLTLDMLMVNADATPSGNVNIDWAAYCISHNDAYGNNAYGAETAMDFDAGAVVQNDLIVASTAAGVALSGCSAGDLVKVRGQIDAAGTTSNDMANLHFIWATVHLTMNAWSN